MRDLKARRDTPTTHGLQSGHNDPLTDGKRPYWPDSALKDHIKPAAVEAGITMRATWYVFRHSLASFLG